MTDDLNLCSDISRVPSIVDVLVIGAGPAGAFLAAELAQHGVNVLLVDKDRFARYKVCGACLGSGALSILRQSSVADRLENILNKIPQRNLNVLSYSAGNMNVEIEIPQARALSRSRFDSALVQAGLQSGTVFLSDTAAKVRSQDENGVQVSLTHQHCNTFNIRSRIVVACDGIGGTALSDLARFNVEVASHSRVGVGAIVNSRPATHQDNFISMFYHRSGYLGAVTLEDGSINMAASIDVDFLRCVSGPHNAAKIILDGCMQGDCDIESAHWRGTQPLTMRRKNVWGERIFVVGDAAGYIEPFTGEGMTSALASSQLVLPLVLDALRSWHPDLGRKWQHTYSTMIRTNQFACKIAAAVLHHPILAASAANVFSIYPKLGRKLAQHINQQYGKRL